MPVTVNQLLHRAAQQLDASGATAPMADARILLAHALDIEPGELVWAQPTPAQRNHFAALLAERARGIPVQHLTGQAWFRNVELAVGPGVFIPRPETELVAGAAIEEARRLGVDRPVVVVDLCTGSGAIAAAIADEAPNTRVVAVELDDKAIEYARANLHGTGVLLMHCDLRDIPSELGDLVLDGQVDVVVANPPYLPSGVWDELPTDVRDHDPSQALFSGAEGLDALRAIEPVARRLLRAGGLLVVEHDDSHGEAAPKLLAARGWVEVRDYDDLTGRPRWVTARRQQAGREKMSR